MKKIFTLVAATVLALGTLSAQNSFKGIVKYKVESTGQVAMQIPEEVANAEIKVSGNSIYTKSDIFLMNFGGMAECVLVENLKMTACINYSPILGYLRGQGSEFTYQGEGKIMITQNVDVKEMDSLYIEDKEPGHFYYEEVASETKMVAGMKATKLIRHMYDEEGEDHPMVMWVSHEIGPETNVLFSGIKGMPLECTLDAGEGRALTYTATEVVKGKVKEADFLLPFGYETLSEEELETLGTELQEELELLQE